LFEVRAADAGATGSIIEYDTTGGVGPGTYFQGRYGASPHDTWENNTLASGSGELFYNQWFVVRSGQPPVYVTTACILNGAGNVRAIPALNVARLTDVDLSTI
jgi:hypothetical protein